MGRQEEGRREEISLSSASNRSDFQANVQKLEGIFTQINTP
jgi:hypothetical protein